MLITKIKLDTLLDEMTTKKAKRAVNLWAINQGQVTMDTLNALDLNKVVGFRPGSSIKVC